MAEPLAVVHAFRFLMRVAGAKEETVVPFAFDLRFGAVDLSVGCICEADEPESIGGEVDQAGNLIPKNRDASAPVRQEILLEDRFVGADFLRRERRMGALTEGGVIELIDIRRAEGLTVKQLQGGILHRLESQGRARI